MRVTDEEIEEFMALLSRLTIKVEDVPPLAMIRTGLIAVEQFQLTAYDAAYVDLALQESLELATLDKAMRKAALQAGVILFEP